MLGSLDDAPTDLRPSYEIWTPRRESWLLPRPWCAQFERDAPEAW
jgi:hypothetical protein